jgi:Xaa-Pro aminopeptidase
MSEFGFMGVDWEERINFDRLRRERLQKAKEAMEKSDVDALFVFALEDVRYLTGFRSHLGPVTILGLAAVVLPRGGDPILWTVDTVHCRARMPWIKPDNVFERPFIRSEGGTKKWAEEVKGKIGKLAEGKIGVDLWSFGLSQWLPKCFPKAQLVDGKEVLSQAKMIKTQDEIECHRISCAITEEIFDAVRMEIRPGVRENDLAAVVNNVALRRGCDGPTEPNISSGENTHPNMMHHNMRPIRPGDMIFLDLHMRYRGYHTCVYRCFTCGRATQQQKELHEETRRLLYDAINKVKAGVTTADIANVWPGPEHWGFKTWRECSENALGHGIGLDNHEAPMITPLFSGEHPVTLQENMVLALETYYGTLPMTALGEGARLEEDIVVTKDGFEMLTRWPIKEIVEAWI